MKFNYPKPDPICSSFTEKTWSTYAKYLISWFKFAKLDIQDRLIDIRKGRGLVTVESQQLDFIPNKRPKKDLDVFCTLKDQSKPENYSKIYSSLYDLRSIGLIKYPNKTVYFTETGKLIRKKIGTKEFEESISFEALKTKKLKQASKYLSEQPSCSRREFKEALSTLTTNIKSEAYRQIAYNILYAWAKFIYDCLGKEKLDSIINEG